MFYVYILESQKDNNLYVGATSNMKKRFDAHNKGEVRSTKNRRPFILVHKEEYKTLSEARKREWYLKNHPTGQQLKKKLVMGR